VVPVGSIYRAGDAYLDPFERALADRSAVPFEIRPAALSAVGGAVLLAARLLDMPIEGLARRLSASELAYERGDA
jgi:hypothetical protein